MTQATGPELTEMLVIHEKHEHDGQIVTVDKVIDPHVHEWKAGVCQKCPLTQPKASSKE